MKKLILLATFFLTIHFHSFAQGKNKLVTEEKEAVMNVIHQLFDGMRAGDSSMVRETFYHQVDMFTSFTNREGKAVLKKDDVEKFVSAVGTPHDEVWDELLWDWEIQVDNNLAQVWTKYGFYLGDQFSHCGVDAFLLTKTEEGWKIFHLTDTRQREGCEVPEELKK